MDGLFGQILFVGFDGVSLTPDLRGFLREVRPGGIILFRRNIETAAQTVRLIADLKACLDPPPLLAVDEEGGRVSRLSGIAPTLPPGARLAAMEDPAQVRALAAALGRVVASLGFDIDFAPVLDLCAPETDNGIGDRSFGTDPRRAAAYAAAYLEGLAEAGVAGCLKHFPGLGPTSCDSHLELPTVRKPERTFLDEDLLPYRLLRGHAPIVMVAHGHYPFLCGEDPVAATLVPAVSTDLLRREIGYEGLAMADDLEMKAVSARVPWDVLAPRAVAAGCDMVLVCRDRDAVRASHAALRAAIDSGVITPARLDEAIGRIAALRAAVAKLGDARGEASVDRFEAARADLTRRLDAIP